MEKGEPIIAIRMNRASFHTAKFPYDVTMLIVSMPLFPSFRSRCILSSMERGTIEIILMQVLRMLRRRPNKPTVNR
jgi:hypothetical protein